MRFVYEQPELERELDAARQLADLDAALRKVTGLNSTFRDPDIYGRRLFSRKLDALVPRIMRRLNLADVPLEKSNDNVCVIATRFYLTGGHSQVAIDIAKRLAPDSVTAIFTDVYDELRYANALNGADNRSPLKERAALLLQSDTLAERIVELYMMLAAIRPSRILLMGHNMDIVAVAGAWPFRSVVEFVHHADHAPGIGATLPFSAHVDLTYTCHLACREAGLDPIYAGMTAPLAEPVTRPAAAGGTLRIATCGSQHKYEGVRGHAWKDYAVAALRRPDTELIHLGPTKPEFESEIRNALIAAGIAPERYVFAGWVPSLGAELQRREVDVYLSSFPESGGKSNLEAMAARLPVVLPRAADLPPLLQYQLPLPYWIEVHRPDELSQGIDAALDLGRTMRRPEEVERLDREMRRFDEYVAGVNPAPPAAA